MFEIEGPNDYSKSMIVRLIDNGIVRPLGGNPGFSVSFDPLEADEKEVAVLVRQIVDTARASAATPSPAA